MSVPVIRIFLVSAFAWEKTHPFQGLLSPYCPGILRSGDKETATVMRFWRCSLLLINISSEAAHHLRLTWFNFKNEQKM